MDYRTVTKSVLLIVAVAFAAAACNNPNKVMPHDASEQKAIDELNHMTPQQQIDRIQNGPMPEAAKQAQIQKIKDKAGIK